ncbi:FecR domain-containing protein [Orrella sp. JC864]|uniref:FecR family protein n=1 Tax=Orrella sp. JC864 TaxID=3120298 RepID=UPI003008FA43
MKTSVEDSGLGSSQLEQEARAWLRLLASGQVRQWDAEAFKRWLDTSVAHRQAFAQVKRRWDLLKPAAGEYLYRHPLEAARHEQAMARRPARAGRRAFLGAAAGAAAVAGVTAFTPAGRLLLSPAQWGADYRTGTGEQRSLQLAGRVNVMLNTQTSIRQQAGAPDGAAGIDLLAGEAAIDLPEGSALFAVAAGAGRSLSGAGSFEVRYLDGIVCVSCIDGQVQVEHPAGGGRLLPRQQLLYDARHVSAVAAIEPTRVSAWRHGELVFERTRLAEVIAEINRYRQGRVVLMNEAVRNQAVSGRFRVASLDAALQQLQHTFALSARSLPGGLMVLS